MDNPKRIGVYGGTFDPVHRTHVEVARSALAHAHLDCVLFVVAGCPPHKKHDVFAGAEDRVELVRAALATEPHMDVSRIEVDRPGPSYTVDTLAALHTAYPGAELFLILGYDSFVDLPRWRDPQGILARAKLLVVPRAGAGHDTPGSLEGHHEMLPFVETDVSSTEIRRRIAEGEDVGDLLPPAVEQVIRTRRLYHVRGKDAAV